MYNIDLFTSKWGTNWHVVTQSILVVDISICVHLLSDKFAFLTPDNSRFYASRETWHSPRCIRYVMRWYYYNHIAICVSYSSFTTSTATAIENLHCSDDLFLKTRGKYSNTGLPFSPFLVCSSPFLLSSCIFLGDLQCDAFSTGFFSPELTSVYIQPPIVFLATIRFSLTVSFGHAVYLRTKLKSHE